MDRENVIKGLECCASMKGSACRECPYSSECIDYEAIYQTGTAHLAADALELLKKQENEIDVSIPEQFWASMRYDPSEDVVACTSCLICGKDIPLRRYESGPRVCSECKEAVTAMKRGD